MSTAARPRRRCSWLPPLLLLALFHAQSTDVRRNAAKGKDGMDEIRLGIGLEDVYNGARMRHTRTAHLL